MSRGGERHDLLRLWQHGDVCDRRATEYIHGHTQRPKSHNVHAASIASLLARLRQHV
jgi:hypothetical protein